MGDKVYMLVIKVDLNCCRCRQRIQDHLCKIQRKEQIVAIVYDEKNNIVRVSGSFNPEQLKRKLLCKLPKIIIGIEIGEPPKPKQPDPPKPPKKDECKEKFMKQCEEEYEEITKSIEQCKKECEEKCRKQYEDKLKRKCNCKCACDCKKPPEKPNETPKEPPKEPSKEPQKEKESAKEPSKPPPQWLLPPIFPWTQHGATICCASPCPCLVAWSNNYRCCSCGVVSWPGGCQPGWGNGQGSWGPPPQWGCEPSKTPNIIVESTPPCTIM